MKIYLLTIGCFLTVGTVSSAAQIAVPFEGEALTLELSFGDKDMPDEFLLAQPDQLLVDRLGRILTFDESSVKVYSYTGEPLQIVGGPGQGPGEFPQYIYSMQLLPGNNLYVRERSGYNLFSPEYEFIEKRRFSTIPELNGIEDTYRIDVSGTMDCRRIGENEYLVVESNMSPENYNEENDYTDYLLHIDSDGITEIASYKIVNAVAKKIGGGWSRKSEERLGSFFCRLTPGGRIVYTHTHWENTVKDGKGTLKIHSVNLDGTDRKTVEIAYVPEKIDKSYIDTYDIRITMNGQKPVDIENRMKDMMRAREYSAPFTSWEIDGETLCFIRYRREDKQVLYDLWFYNRETGNLRGMCTIDIFPTLIHKGCVYRVFYGNEEEFPRIEKYRIDPAVYGK